MFDVELEEEKPRSVWKYRQDKPAVKRFVKKIIYDEIFPDHEKGTPFYELKDLVRDFSDRLPPKQAAAMFRCRPSAPLVVFKPTQWHEKWTKLKHTCRLKICPHCHYRKMIKAFKHLRAFKKRKYLAAWMDIPIRNISVNDPISIKAFHAQVSKMIKAVRRRMLKTYGFSDGVLITKVHAPNDYEPGYFWVFRLGFCTPIFDDAQIPATVKLTGAKHKPSTMMVDVDLATALRPLCVYPALLLSRDKDDLEWYMQVTNRIKEVQRYGKPPEKVRAVSKKPVAVEESCEPSGERQAL